MSDKFVSVNIEREKRDGLLLARQVLVPPSYFLAARSDHPVGRLTRRQRQTAETAIREQEAKRQKWNVILQEINALIDTQAGTVFGYYSDNLVQLWDHLTRTVELAEIPCWLAGPNESFQLGGLFNRLHIWGQQLLMRNHDTQEVELLDLQSPGKSETWAIATRRDSWGETVPLKFDWSLEAASITLWTHMVSQPAITRRIQLSISVALFRDKNNKNYKMMEPALARLVTDFLVFPSRQQV